MRRLATQIHATVLGVLLLFSVLVAAAWWHGPGMREEMRLAEATAETVAGFLPGPDRPDAELQAMLDRLGPRFGVDAAAFAGDGRLLASVGRPLERPTGRGAVTHVRVRGRELTVVLGLRDGRLLIARRSPPGWQHFGAVVAVVALLALAVGVGAWPLVRRLTRRLERLRRRVDDLGRGELSVRAPVEGRDEVADLARSFNRAADRIETLVEAQRRQLAFASHELRSPLARLRVSLELLAGDPELKAKAAGDIAELDGLVEELLQASRLQARGGLDRSEAVDLLALAAEESARIGAEASGQAVVVQGDARLLRRLLRNLLDNARRHGGGSAVEARVEVDGTTAWLRICDRGPGVPAKERERVFEPFYRPEGSPETGTGYGLGLALVRQIARAHGGEVRCLERAGGGSVFAVRLPVG